MISETRPILCYVTDRAGLPAPAGLISRPAGVISEKDDRGAALIERIRQAAAAGVDWIELREKDLEGRALANLAREILAALRQATPTAAAETSPGPSARHQRLHGRLLINDRVDVALCVGAGGVHLGENSLPVSAARALLAQQIQARPAGEDCLLGVSCHSLEKAQRAAGDGADYIIFGPVFATPSKAAFGPPQGRASLEAVCRAVSIPVLAIGGVSAANARQCTEAGAAGIAAIRLFQEASNLSEVVADLRATLQV